VQARPQQADLPAASAVSAPAATPPATARPAPATATPTTPATPAVSTPAAPAPATPAPATPAPAVAPAAAASMPEPAPVAKTSDPTSRPGGWTVGPSTMTSPLPDVAHCPRSPICPGTDDTGTPSGCQAPAGCSHCPSPSWSGRRRIYGVLHRLGWHSIYRSVRHMISPGT
jgi:hypothetical protein